MCERLNKHLGKQDIQAGELEFLEDDIEKHKAEVKTRIRLMYELADGYKNIDGREEIRSFVMDLL